MADLHRKIFGMPPIGPIFFFYAVFEKFWLNNSLGWQQPPSPYPLGLSSPLRNLRSALITSFERDASAIKLQYLILESVNNTLLNRSSDKIGTLSLIFFLLPFLSA